MRILVSLLFAAAVCSAADAPAAGFERPYLREKGWKALLDGKDLKGWLSRDNKPNQWFTTTAVMVEPGNPKRLAAEKGTGPIAVNAPEGKVNDIYTADKYGDVEVYVEWMIPKGSNSGVYLHGLYEIQVFDSYGVPNPDETQAGGIYHRWINEKPVGGSKPKVNASRAPGEWQWFHAWFQAPRFDASGKKTEDAKFLKVVYNGQLVQENVSVDGGTRAHMEIPEAPKNPLMLQGDHGPVAYRNIYIRPLRTK